jgi:N-acetyl sugar amidotransferase
MANLHPLEKQLLAQPQEVRFCARCVVSNQRPQLTLDEQGICSDCRFREYESGIDWGGREAELAALCDRFRSKGGQYDVVVPTSGGKDSGYVASVLRDLYGMRPICACFAPFRRTEIGQRNFDAFKSAGFSVVEGHPNEKLHRKLARLYFEQHGDAWGPFGLGQMVWPHQVASLYNIGLVFYGENGQAAYSGDAKVWNLRGMPADLWAEQYHKGATIEEMVRFGLKNTDYLTVTDFRYQDLDFYRAPSGGWSYEPPSIRTPQPTITPWPAPVEMHWMSYYHHWQPQENFYWATQQTGFTANPERSEGTYSKYASLDDKTDGFHFYMAFIKFGIGRATSDAAHEIRDRHITREEGVSLVQRYDGEFPRKYFREFLRYLEISESHFWKVVDVWRPAHLWSQEGGRWLLKHQIAREGAVDGPWNP